MAEHKIKVFDIPKFEDARGYLSPVWSQEISSEIFVEDRLSVSKQFVLRGLHGDNRVGKLFIPVVGHFQLYAREIKGDDSIFIDLHSDSPMAVYVPPGYINGHLCLGSGNNVLLYKWTNYYNEGKEQVTVKWDCDELCIPWKVDNPLLSERDKLGIKYGSIHG